MRMKGHFAESNLHQAKIVLVASELESDSGQVVADSVELYLCCLPLLQITLYPPLSIETTCGDGVDEVHHIQ
jgi:hypothetical protein